MGIHNVFIITLLLTLGTHGMKINLYHRRHVTHVALLQQTGMTAKLGIFNHEYVIHFEIGTPPQKTFGVFDMASHLLWLQMTPCYTCLNQPIETRHNLWRSSTLRRVMCEEEACTMSYTNGRCNSEISYYDYAVRYVDNTSSRGYLTKDIFRFSDGPPVELLVGIGMENMGAEFRRGNPELFDCPGVFGIGKLSRYQLEKNFKAKVFSYSIPSDTAKTGYVHIGEDVDWTSTVTDMGNNEHLIYLALDSIKFNGVPLLNPDVEPSEGDFFDWSGEKLLLDTGSPDSQYNPVMFKALLDEFENLLGRPNILSYYTCWRRKLTNKAIIDSITITFHFGDVAFNLSRPQIWTTYLGYPDYYYLMFYEGTNEQPSILGTTQTTDKNIAINYNTNKIAIVDRKC